MEGNQIKDKLLAAQKLLSGPTFSKDTFDAVQSLLKGVNPKIDILLSECSKPLNQLQKIRNAEVIELTVESIPETTEKDKKRKKYLLLLIKYWKQLKSEVDRVRGEFDQMETTQEELAQTKGLGRIVGFAQGPFGIVTLAALAIVGVGIFIRISQKSATPSKSAVQFIVFEGKSIPLSGLYIGKGADCPDNAPHYHAIDHIQAVALDGTKIADPGACGFGKTSDVKVVEQ